jgi:hypothetical protein
MVDFFSKYLPLAPNAGGDSHLKVTLGYKKGRGYVLYLTPVSIQDGFVRAVLGRGTAFLVESAGRLNRKVGERLGRLADVGLATRTGPFYEHVKGYLDGAKLALVAPSEEGAA